MACKWFASLFRSIQNTYPADNYPVYEHRIFTTVSNTEFSRQLATVSFCGRPATFVCIPPRLKLQGSFCVVKEIEILGCCLGGVSFSWSRLADSRRFFQSALGDVTLLAPIRLNRLVTGAVINSAIACGGNGCSDCDTLIQSL